MRSCPSFWAPAARGDLHPLRLECSGRKGRVVTVQMADRKEKISRLSWYAINPSESVDSDGFSLVFITFLGSLFLLFLFDPNRDPYGILSCSLETGHDSLAQSSLEAAGEQVSHGFCRLPLGCRGHVGVSVQGEPGAEVPQHPRHRFHIHPVLQGQGGKCVP